MVLKQKRLIFRDLGVKWPIIQAGMVWVNAPLLDNDAGPFGGTKLSGLGRQLGPEGIATFRETKTVMIDPACNPLDFWWFPYADDEAYSKK